jgi:oligoribonuclease (3'-5' exoribonuclease)
MSWVQVKELNLTKLNSIHQDKNALQEYLPHKGEFLKIMKSSAVKEITPVIVCTASRKGLR